MVVSTGQGWEDEGGIKPGAARALSEASQALFSLGSIDAASGATSPTPQPWAGLAAGLMHSHPRLHQVLTKHWAAATSHGPCVNNNDLAPATAHLPHEAAARRSGAPRQAGGNPQLDSQEICEELLQV